MANIPAQGMKAFTFHVSNDDSSNGKVVEAWNAVRNKKPTKVEPTPVPMGSFDEPGMYSLGDLPMRFWDDRTTTNQCIDVIKDVEAQFDFEDVQELITQGKYVELPAPLSPATNTQILHDMNLRVFKQGCGDKQIVLKHIIFCQQENVQVVKDEIIRGAMCSIDWVPDRSGSKKVFQYMFERLPGVGYRYWSWPETRPRQAGRGPAVDSDVAARQDKIRRAIQYIKDEAPRGNFDCEQTTWLECELVNPASALNELRRETIGRILQVIKDKDNVATKMKEYPLFHGDIRKEYQDIINDIIPTLLTNTLLLVGEAGFGKTPLMTVLAFAMARWHAHKEALAGRHVEPAVRTSSEMDFFRGEVGERWAPCLFDDGDMSDQRPKVLKAFFDPTQMEAMAYARWGAAKFVRGQARFGGDNAYDEEAEPSNSTWVDGTFGVPDKERRFNSNKFLLDMVRPAFPRNLSRPNVGAMLKRCTIMLNTTKFLYVRMAGLESETKRYPLHPGYLEPGRGKILYDFLKEGKRREPEECDRLLGFEARTVARLLPGLSADCRVPPEAEDPAAAPAPDAPDNAAPDAAADTELAEDEAAAREAEAQAQIFGDDCDEDPHGHGAAGFDAEPDHFLEDALEALIDEELSGQPSAAAPAPPTPRMRGTAKG